MLFKTFNRLESITQFDSSSLFEPDTTIESQSSVEGEFDYTANINRYGYRGNDFDLKKERGLKRVFAVGDSFTFGVGSEDYETIPYLVEEKLMAIRGMLACALRDGSVSSSGRMHWSTRTLTDDETLTHACQILQQVHAVGFTD